MTKEEKIENYLRLKGLSDKEIKSDTTGLRRITKEIILEAINWACSNLKEEQNKNFPPIQMICDSQGCREVDLFGRPITPVNEEIRESSFEVMLEDEIQTTLDNTLLYKCSACGKTYSGSTPIQCECGRKHGWIVLSSALQDDVNKALELHGRLKLGDSEAPDWADSKDKYILKINYDRDGVTQPSVNCSNAKWKCPKCGNQFYEFPYKGCFCGAKGEELLQIEL